MFFVSALAGIAFAGASGLREVHDMSLGWRFYKGTPGSSNNCSAASFPTNFSNYRCSGLASAPQAASPADCAQAACDNYALVWQWCTKPANCGQKSLCWIGNVDQCRYDPGDWLSYGDNSTAPSPVTPAPANVTFNDSAWEVVDAPHDALITSPYNVNASNGQGSILKSKMWYRKHINLPANWSSGAHVSLYFEGVFSITSVWLNGVSVSNHSCGYTSFAVRLDNVSGVVWGGANVLALFVDGTVTTGWWYEGAGIFRGVRLVRSPLLRAADDGLFAPAFTTGAYHTRATPGAGITADNATISPTLTVELAQSVDGAETALAAPGSAAPFVTVSAAFALYAADGVTLLGTSTRVAVNVTPGAGPVTTPPATFTVADAELWSLPRPYLHTLVATLFDAAGAAADTINVTLGVRDLVWDARNGLFVNGQAAKLRGFCNHASFTGVGMAVPPRINLLRLQQLRGVGGNAWRMSHNPGSPDTFALGDALGVAFLDENRVFNDAPGDVANMGDMVRRDRQHASILWWSFCNEGGCSPATQPALDFKLATNDVDGSRAVTGNMFWAQVQSSRNATDILDVQGFSHQSSSAFADFHALFPEKPVAATECCSCMTQRAEDADLPRAPGVTSSSWSQSCTRDQSQTSNAPDWIMGTFVWTLHDYIGEPGGWPHVSSRFGQFDLAGFPKAPAYWYRAWWLSNVSAADGARPPLSGPGADAGTVVHIVETWQAPPAGTGANRTVHVYTSAPAVALSLGAGKPLAGGEPQSVPAFGWATFTVPYAPGALTATALAADNVTALAAAVRPSWGAPAALVLSLDVPTAASGTGAALYLDGGDVALVRATVVDAAGNTCEDATANVTFTVAEGPGLVVGVGNGDPGSQDPNQAAWRPAYHGLARAVVRVTLDARGSDAERAARTGLNPDAGAGPRSSVILPPGATPPQSLSVSATAPGLSAAAPLAIPLSADPAAAPLAVAAASVGAAWLT